ncbi:MAG: NAD(P)H-hydrate dehydratase [Dehalococcoidia bacterium]|jgi:NAD(P)H-hydrate repair Nnr-like enzyme with NAD(P)H-hydrate dehydratase domain
MTLLIAGTIPDRNLPLTVGEVASDGDYLTVDKQRFLCMQGTGAMISAVLAVTSYFKLAAPRVVVAGDIGDGTGSRAIYDLLIHSVDKFVPTVLALHYWLPDMAQTKRLCEAVDKCDKRPIMIADAASMYSAKASGMAPKFDIFTPDATEMAFLADPNATHPAYIARHLFSTDVTQTPNLIGAAYANKSAAKVLLVKGAIDYIVSDGKIVETIDKPDVPALEPIGGTGDTITGLVAGLVYIGLEPHEAAIIAARTNRVAGQMANLTPATKVSEIIRQFPAVFEKYLCEWSGGCCIKGEGNE